MTREPVPESLLLMNPEAVGSLVHVSLDDVTVRLVVTSCEQFGTRWKVGVRALDEGERLAYSVMES